MLTSILNFQKCQTPEFQKRLEALGEETKKDVTSKFQQEYIDKAISNAKFYYRMN